MTPTLYRKELAAWLAELDYNALHANLQPEDQRLPIHIREWWDPRSVLPSPQPPLVFSSTCILDVTGWGVINMETQSAITNMVSNMAPGATGSPPFRPEFRLLVYFMNLVQFGGAPPAVGSNPVPKGLYRAIALNLQNAPLGLYPPTNALLCLREEIVRKSLVTAYAPPMATQGFNTACPSAPDYLLDLSHPFQRDFLVYSVRAIRNAFATLGQTFPNITQLLGGLYSDAISAGGYGPVPLYIGGCGPIPVPVSDCAAPVLLNSVCSLPNQTDRAQAGTVLDGIAAPDPFGGGNRYTRRALNTLEKVRDLVGGSPPPPPNSPASGTTIPEFFMQNEQANEGMIGLGESYYAYQTIMGVDAGAFGIGDSSFIANMECVPLFATVYHDFVMLTEYFGLFRGDVCPFENPAPPGGNTDGPFPYDPVRARIVQYILNPSPSNTPLPHPSLVWSIGDFGRRSLAEAMHFGHQPYAGTYSLDAVSSLDNLRNNPTVLAAIWQNLGMSCYASPATTALIPDALDKAYEFMRSLYKVWCHGLVRAFVIFGVRRRDPVSTSFDSQGASNAISSGLYYQGMRTVFVDQSAWRKIPPILVSGWTETPVGALMNPTVPHRVGFGIINWTHSVRDSHHRTGVQFRFVPADYGMTSGTYLVSVVDPTLSPAAAAAPAPVGLPSSFVVGSNPHLEHCFPPGAPNVCDATTPILVPQISALFLIMEK